MFLYNRTNQRNNKLEENDITDFLYGNYKSSSNTFGGMALDQDVVSRPYDMSLEIQKDCIKIGNELHFQQHIMNATLAVKYTMSVERVNFYCNMF